jgi:hypothetical protein
MLTESEIKHVLDALCGYPTVTTPEFADRVEKTLREASSTEGCSLNEHEITHVMNILCGYPAVTSPEFADRIEKILRGGSSGKESDISLCLTGLNAYGEACSNEEYEILARREPTTNELHAIINHLVEKLYPYEHDN